MEQGKVMSQVEVGCKENEITKAPKALKMVEIAEQAFAILTTPFSRLCEIHKSPDPLPDPLP